MIECFKKTEQIVTKAIHIIGMPYDGSSCFRKGADQGPVAMRDIFESLETYSPYLDLDLEEKTIYDLGDIPLFPYGNSGQEKMFQLYWQKIAKIENFKLVTLGGEHSISFAPIKKYLQAYPELTLIHLDAHADLRDGYLGFPCSHASVIFRVQELFGKKHSLLQYGIRSGTKEEFDWMRKHNSKAQSRQEFLERVSAIQGPIYLTLDFDYFDPAYFPGTGTPEAGGEDFHSFVSLMKILKHKEFVGADLVELAPSIDPTGNSTSFAAKVLREVLLAL